MADEWPKILGRSNIPVSPWMSVIAREVEFASGQAPEVYHAVEQLDYLAIVARTPDGRIAIVRQYRPAVEAFTWELPAGLVERNEDPAEGCRRELLEETGLPTLSIHALGEPLSPCTGRLNNRVHSYFVEAGDVTPGFAPEPGVTPKLVTPAELVAMIRTGAFVQQLHLGALLLAELRSFLTLPR